MFSGGTKDVQQMQTFFIYIAMSLRSVGYYHYPQILFIVTCELALLLGNDSSDFSLLSPLFRIQIVPSPRLATSRGLFCY